MSISRAYVPLYSRKALLRLLCQKISKLQTFNSQFNLEHLYARRGDKFTECLNKHRGLNTIIIRLSNWQWNPHSGFGFSIPLTGIMFGKEICIITLERDLGKLTLVKLICRYLKHCFPYCLSISALFFGNIKIFTKRFPGINSFSDITYTYQFSFCYPAEVFF